MAPRNPTPSAEHLTTAPKQPKVIKQAIVAIRELTQGRVYTLACGHEHTVGTDGVADAFAAAHLGRPGSAIYRRNAEVGMRRPCEQCAEAATSAAAPRPPTGQRIVHAIARWARVDLGEPTPEPLLCGGRFRADGQADRTAFEYGRVNCPGCLEALARRPATATPAGARQRGAGGRLPRAAR